MTYQQRIKNHDDPLSVAIDADREIAELKANIARLLKELKENSVPREEIERLVEGEFQPCAYAHEHLVNELKQLLQPKGESDE